MPVSVTVLGSVNLDLIVQTTTLPRAGETVTGGRFTSLPGGKGANVAVAARRLGAEVALVGAVGADDYATQALVNLRAEGVNLDGLVTVDTHTGLAFISVADDGENQIAVASGANGAFTGDALPPIRGDVLITQFEIPPQTIAAALDGFTGFVAVNASPVTMGVDEILTRADLVIVNQGEAEAYDLAGRAGLLAVTLGASGAELWRDGELIARAKPPKVKVVDTTGAGDAFAAALAVALTEGMAEQAALDFACAVGALTTTKLGTQTASPRRAEVEVK